MKKEKSTTTTATKITYFKILAVLLLIFAGIKMYSCEEETTYILKELKGIHATLLLLGSLCCQYWDKKSRKDEERFAEKVGSENMQGSPTTIFPPVEETPKKDKT